MATVSNKPWSQFSDSDYNDAQYERACLIDRGGSGTAKERCSLPVREPNGMLNRNGIHAAAAALAGAHGGLKGVSPAQKKAAAKKLVSLYHQIGDTPPPSITKLAG